MAQISDAETSSYIMEHTQNIGFFCIHFGTVGSNRMCALRSDERVAVPGTGIESITFLQQP